MPVPAWPSTLPLRPRAQSLNASPRRMVAAFEPEQGLEISRPRVSAAIHVLTFETPALTTSQMTTLRTFFEETLRGGAIAFSWIDPRNNEAWLWKPTPDTPYRETDLGGGFTQVSLSLVRQPGRPWWSTYVMSDESTVPLLVLDFQNSIHGRPPTRETLTSLQALQPAIGLVDLYRISNTGVITTALSQTINAAWWAALVPASWRRIVAFPAGSLV